MPSWKETASWLGDGDAALFSMLYEPAAPPAGAVLLCDPVFEERKSAQRALVETARALAGAGLCVLRFDYRGCGESGGTFGDFTAGDWLADCATAAAHLRRRSGDAPFALLGLRLGATLAWQAAAQAGARAVVLWEPVLKGKDYIEQELRKKLMKEMVTTGGSASRRAELLQALEQEGGSIDFDGYRLSAALYRSLCALDLTAAPAPAFAALAIGVNAQGAPAPAVRQAVAQWSAAGARAEARGVREQPFWNLIGYVDCAPLIRESAEWLRATLTAP